MPMQPEEDIIDQVTTNESNDDAAPADRGDNFVADEEPVAVVAEEPAIVADPVEPPKADAKPDERTEDRTESRIPKARFDEVNEERKQYKAQLEEMQRQLDAVKAATQPAKAEPKDSRSDLEAAEDYYLQAVQAGDMATARQVRAAINNHLQQQAALVAEQRVTETLKKKDVETSMLAVANESLKKYDFLSDASDNKNAEAIAEVIEWRDYYIAKGVRGDVALERAVNKIGPMYAPKVAPVEPKGEPKVDERPRAALTTNAKAAAAQPSQLLGLGERSSNARHNVTKMTDDEFDALPAAEKKRLRGDA